MSIEHPVQPEHAEHPQQPSAGPVARLWSFRAVIAAAITAVALGGAGGAATAVGEDDRVDVLPAISGGSR